MKFKCWKESGTEKGKLGKMKLKRQGERIRNGGMCLSVMLSVIIL